MNEFDEVVLKTFIEKQLQLFPEEVCSNMAEAEEFLEDCMAVVCNNADEVLEYFEEVGSDISQMSKEELLEAEEVFAIDDGRYLIVEG